MLLIQVTFDPPPPGPETLKGPPKIDLFSSNTIPEMYKGGARPYLVTFPLYIALIKRMILSHKHDIDTCVRSFDPPPLGQKLKKVHRRWTFIIAEM